MYMKQLTFLICTRDYSCTTCLVKYAQQFLYVPGEIFIRGCQVPNYKLVKFEQEFLMYPINSSSQHDSFFLYQVTW